MSNNARVPDAVQRLFGGAPQSRDPSCFHRATYGPRICSAPRRKRGALRSVPGTPPYPLAAPAFANRLRIRSNSPSSTSR
jgi:hypothetical protein